METITLDTNARGITSLTLNRPERNNALNRQCLDELSEALASIDTNTTRALVLTGAGKHFCAGADIAWMRESIRLSDAENRADAQVLSDLLERLNTLPCPTIALVDGAAMGGGSGLVCCCDIALASERAFFAFSEVKLGLIPATISPYVVAAIGARAARRYFQTAEKIDSGEAREIGLVHEVVAENDLSAALGRTVDALLLGGPASQAASKQLIRRVDQQAVTDELREELAATLARIRAGDEAQEGLAAFEEKRQPAFQG